ncbi:alpha/beta hydrolase [Flavobacterium faecale]|uniref:Alpha/beta hydrolase n=1 Tax=Flavobacterium faecale TaxID=1355330 RepID=A0A2S1LJ31_9FLAO|nr:alpha/beta fold hydrolase [Flavobacterium faecale]AWG23496.1 alpha/beta hydrolase [Flavobacterium faecale]
MEVVKVVKFLVCTVVPFVGVLYALLLVYVYYNQTSMIFHTEKLPANYKFDYPQKFEEINTKSFDNVNLNGLLFRAENPKGLVFYLHGNAGTLGTWGSISKIYTDLGYDIFIMDYRGFGKSDGEIVDETQINKDVALVYSKLCKRYAEKDIYIAGYSIGSGLATILASNNQPKALLLQSPYYSFTELSSKIAPYFPNFIKRFKLESYSYFTKIKAPIYIFHGEDDELIPVDNGLKLSKLKSAGIHYFGLKNQGHGDMNENEVFQKELQTILN